MVVGHDLGSMLGFGYSLRYRDDVVSLTTMEAPLPGTDYNQHRKVAKTAWHFDFHSQPDIAVYLSHGRERLASTSARDTSPACDRASYHQAVKPPSTSRSTPVQ